MATRWGICGAGKICGDFAGGLTTLPSSEHKAVAVAARDLSRAQEFAKERGIATAYGSYLELAQDANVDVVYIGTIHPEHHKLTLLFLNHGKHVLVEKPAAMNLKQLKEMTSLAKEKKLFFMEAVWTRFFPIFKRVLEELAKQTVGKARMLRVQFAFPAFSMERISNKALGGGALLDLGVYPLNIAVFLFGKPDKVTIEGTMIGDVDEAGCIIFKYNDGRMAELNYSAAYEGTNDVVIFGTKGQIKINSPMWCPTEMTLPSETVTIDLPKTDAKFHYRNSAGLSYEADHVRQCILKGLTESALLPVSHSEFVMGLVDQVKREVVAVAARELSRAQTFAKERGIPKAYGSYIELAQDANVDVVYIGTIHPEHHKLTLLFLNHGKHVLVEKPAAMNLKQLKEMTSLAKEKKLFFMEAVWTRFFPAFTRVLKEMANQSVGKTRMLRAQLGFSSTWVRELGSDGFMHGCLLPLGGYLLNVAVFLFGRPDKMIVEGTMAGDVDEAGCIIFKYKDGRMAQLSFSSAFMGANDLNIFGTKGQIKIHNPMWCPTEVTLPSETITFDLPKTDAKFTFPNSSGLSYEADHVRQCILKGLTESPLLPLSHSEYVMGLMDRAKEEIRLRCGVHE
ncbi:trans-1,2-dihydrobenzene-1,2-diol dehydrogenase-like [Liolophura sinensis]|uniref:trans-1,2-dihydrobenzene-1,2-diol dehydrogenase-like n=1 Tax=Liolophura sinensis TaxID=3198878 RepID=UPI00315818E2